MLRFKDPAGTDSPITSIKTSSDSDSHSENHIRTPLNFHVNHSIDTVYHPDYDGLIRFSPHSKLWRPEASKILGGRRIPFYFYKKKQGICAVFHADYDGEVRFSPHWKMAPLRALKNDGLGDPFRCLWKSLHRFSFHADYDGAILFSPNAKLWRPEAYKDLLG